MKIDFFELPKICDHRGNLSFIENNKQVPFKIARVYWVYDVPGGEIRGGHAYKTLNECIISLSGSFDLALEDLDGKKYYFTLNRSYCAVSIPKMTWRQIENFSTNALALIIADGPFNDSDYIRSYNNFKILAKNERIY